MSTAADLRNLAFVGHPSSGKTSLVDAFAHLLGASDRKGSVADGTSICDVEPEEQQRHHTLLLAAVHAEQDGTRWNLLDTPGYPEFVGDALSAMFASDLTVGVVSCASGVSFNLAQKMKAAVDMNRGRAILVTHIDGENADFDETIEELRTKIGEICIPVRLPNASGSGFSSVSDGLGDWRKRFCDRVMDACEDEELLMEYLETEELTDEQLEAQVPAAIAKGALVPVFPCNPVSEVGLPEALNWLKLFAPSPEMNEGLTIGGERPELDDSKPLAGVIFNIKSDPHVGKVCLARVLSGKLSAGDLVGEGKGEKLGGLFHAVGGSERTTVDEVGPGEICAFTKVEGLGWGAGFSTAGIDAPAVDVPALPAPTVSLAITPKSRSDEQKIGAALSKLVSEDPCFVTQQVELTHELVIHGMSDLHLKVVEERMKRRYGVEIESSLPRIAYRETVTKPADGHHRHKKQSGGRGQFGECYIRMRPGAADTGFNFLDKVVGGAIPKNLIPAIEKGMRELCNEGVLTTSKVVDVEVEVYDGKFHAVDSDEASFKKAGAWAFRDAFQKAGPVLLEPIMNMEIRVPADSAGSIFSDITSQRRGQVVDQQSEADGAITVIQAHVPLATVQTYHRDLKSITAGEGSYAMTEDHYAAVPANEQQKIIAEFGKKHEEE
ncbi:MAG: elongation factor G [Planctomycetota bacterium]